MLSYRLHTLLPGAILLAALIFAPLFWGCTWPLGIAILNLLILGATSLWVMGMLGQGRWLALPRALMAVTAALLVLGWFMVWNAHSTCEAATGLLVPREKSWAALPGSVNFDRSYDTMTRLTGLLGATLISAWLGRERIWRRLFFWTMAATGGAVALLGCWQRWTWAADIFWATDRHLDFFFSTYRSVTNAGEYLNLVLPLASSLLLGSVMEPRRHGSRAVSTLLFALIGAGALVCGSRLAPLVAGASMFILAGMNWKSLRVHWHTTSQSSRVILGGASAVIAAAIVCGAGLQVDAGRWSALFKPGGDATWGHRWAVDRVCWLAAPEAGWTGFGSGSFQTIFPYYSGRVATDLAGFWTYAHDDYAQTLVEWGWLGAALWGAYLWGGIGPLGVVWCRRSWQTQDQIIGAGLLVSLVMVSLTSLVDFPLQIASIQLYSSVLLGLAWTSPKWTRFKHVWPFPKPAGRAAGISLRRKRVNLR